MSDISTTAFLKIVKGVPKVSQDSSSSESGLDEIDFLDPNGFALDAYDIKIPALKSSAVYADSPLTDGRTLISGTLGNVKETIRLTLNSSTLIQSAALFSKLMRMKQDCRDFWSTFAQIEPVYIKHQVEGEPGPRYALLYDIDVDMESGTDPGQPIRIVTISIEREFGWRGIAPGDNPKRWAIENIFTGQTFRAANASLLSGNDFLFIESNILNRAEQNAAQTSYNTKNFVDIPASKIPGDLPALVCFEYGNSSSTTATALYIAKSTKKNTGNVSRQTGVNQYIVRVFNAADGSMGTDTTLAADTGASAGTSGLQRRSQTTFATATLVQRLGFQLRNMAVQRGRYIAFARARLSASSTTVQLQLSVTEVGAAVQLIGSPVSFTDEGAPSGTGNTTLWGLIYLGVFNIPSDNRRTVVSPNGMGINVSSSTSDDITLGIYAARTAGAGALYINDLILLPIDEGIINLVSTGQGITAPATPSGGLVYDNTGYMTHGRPDEYAVLASAASANYSEYDRLQPQGQPIYLTPGIDNRLEFLAYTDSTKRSNIASPTAVTLRLSIVPRWAGLRDV